MRITRTTSVVVVCLLLVLGLVGALCLAVAQRCKDLQEIDQVYRQLKAHLEAGDLVSARRLCSSDFHGDTGHKTWDADGNGIDPGILESILPHFTGAEPSYGSPWMGASDNGVYYAPNLSPDSSSGSDWIDTLGVGILWEGSGKYLEFKYENGEWRFTGVVGFFVD